MIRRTMFLSVSPLPATALPFLLAFLLWAPGSKAEEKPSEHGRHMRFLAVGEAPPFQQEIRDGVRYELEPPAGSIPPREILPGFGKPEDAKPPVRVSLGRISEPIKVPAGEGPLEIRRREDGEGTAPWLSLTRPGSGDFLVVLWREPKAKTWDKVRSLILPEDPVSMPAGTWRVMNVSTATVGVTLAGEKLLLESGKTFRRILPVGQESICEVFLHDTTGNPKRLYSAGILQNPGERGLVLIYLADGENPRRPVKVSVQREPISPPPQEAADGVKN